MKTALLFCGGFLLWAVPVFLASYCVALVYGVRADVGVLFWSGLPAAAAGLPRGLMSAGSGRLFVVYFPTVGKSRGE